MPTQYWSVQLSESAWLGRLKIACAIVLAFIAAVVFACSLALIGVSGWWGDWLWPWPILLYLSWAVAFIPAPVIDAPQTLTLTETGEFGRQRIVHSLTTPWLIALQLSPGATKPEPGSEPQWPVQWIWVCRDQLSAVSWTRLHRICRYSGIRSHTDN